jgi:hypothetical protein
MYIFKYRTSLKITLRERVSYLNIVINKYINTRNSLPRKKMVEISDFRLICYFKFYDIKCQLTTICFMILLSKIKVLSIILVYL